MSKIQQYIKTLLLRTIVFALTSLIWNKTIISCVLVVRDYERKQHRRPGRNFRKKHLNRDREIFKVAILNDEEVGSVFLNNLSVWDLDHGQVIYAPKNGTTTGTIITLVASSLGIGLSAIALTLLLLTAVLFPEWRQTYKNQVLMQFITARFIYVLLRFFNNVRDVFGLYASNGGYFNFAMIYIMAYTEMAFVFWMLIFSKHMYKSMVKVFDVNESRSIRNILLAWGIPIVLAFLCTFGVIIMENGQLKVLFAYWFSLKWPILLINAVLLCISLRTVLKNNTRAQNNRRITIVMVVLIYVFCVQQFFMDIYMIVHITVLRRKVKVPNSVNILYTTVNIFALYQFAFSAMFWVFGNAKTRQLWKFTPKSQRVISQLSNIRNSTKV